MLQRNDWRAFVFFERPPWMSPGIGICSVSLVFLVHVFGTLRSLRMLLGTPTNLSSCGDGISGDRVVQRHLCSASPDDEMLYALVIISVFFSQGLLGNNMCDPRSARQIPKLISFPILFTCPLLGDTAPMTCKNKVQPTERIEAGGSAKRGEFTRGFKQRLLGHVHQTKGPVAERLAHPVLCCSVVGQTHQAS